MLICVHTGQNTIIRMTVTRTIILIAHDALVWKHSTINPPHYLSALVHLTLHSHWALDLWMLAAAGVKSEDGLHSLPYSVQVYFIQSCAIANCCICNWIYSSKSSAIANCCICNWIRFHAPFKVHVSTVKAPVFGTLNSAIGNFQTWFVRTVMEVLKYCWM